MPRKRTLADLYVVGKTVTFNDGLGEDVSVYIRKLTPVQIEEVSRAAKAAKASATSLKRLPYDHPDRIEYLSDIAEWLNNRDFLIEYLVQDKVARIRAAKEAEVQAEEKWSEDDFIQSIYDAWENGGLKERWHLNHEDEEAARAFAALEEFKAAVDKELEGYEKGFRKEYEGKSLEDLSKLVADKSIELEGDIRFLNEFRRQEIFRGCYDPDDHQVPYFSDRSQVDQLPTEIFKELFEAFAQLNVDTLEGKSLEDAPSS